MQCGVEIDVMEEKEMLEQKIIGYKLTDKGNERFTNARKIDGYMRTNDSFLHIGKVTIGRIRNRIRCVNLTSLEQAFRECGIHLEKDDCEAVFSKYEV